MPNNAFSWFEAAFEVPIHFGLIVALSGFIIGKCENC
jgi:hypothetical protein